jgi:hypothetical protein
MLKKKLSAPAWLVVIFILLLPLYVALANTAYRKLAISNSTIDSTVIGGTSPAAGTFTTGKFTTGIINNGVGLQHMRATSCTTAASAGAFCQTTMTWPVAFANTNYTVVCSTQSGTLFLGAINNKTTTQITPIVELTPGNAAAASTEIDCVGIHDAT